MGFIRSIGRFLGRFIVGAVFVAYAADTFLHWDAVVSSLQHKAIPMIVPALALTMVVAIIGGLFLVFGYRVKLGAFLLLLVTAAVSYGQDDFWNMTDPERMQHLLVFLKNSVIFGSLLLVLSAD